MPLMMITFNTMIPVILIAVIMISFFYDFLSEDIVYWHESLRRALSDFRIDSRGINFVGPY